MYRVCVFVLSTLLALTAVQSEVYVSFMGMRLENGTGEVCTDDIGEEEGTEDPTLAGDALVCVTDNINCCRGADGAPGGVGEWYINGERVPGTVEMSNVPYYRNRGTRLVRLNLPANVTPPLGDYCCEIPDSRDVTQTLCVQGVGRDDFFCVSTITTLPPPTTGGITMTTPQSMATPINGITPPPPPSDAQPNVGAIVGGIFAALSALVLIAIVIIVLYFVLAKRKIKTYSTNMEQLQNVVLEDKHPNKGDTFKSQDTNGKLLSVKEDVAVNNEVYESSRPGHNTYVHNPRSESVHHCTHEQLYEKVIDPSSDDNDSDKNTDTLYYYTMDGSSKNDVSNQSVPEAEYEEVSDPQPAVILKSSEHLEVADYEYVDIRPNTNTAQAPLTGWNMSENPLYTDYQHKPSQGPTIK